MPGQAKTQCHPLRAPTHYPPALGTALQRAGGCHASAPINVTHMRSHMHTCTYTATSNTAAANPLALPSSSYCYTHALFFLIVLRAPMQLLWLRILIYGALFCKVASTKYFPFVFFELFLVPLVL